MHTYIAREIEKIGYRPSSLPNSENQFTWDGLRVGVFRIEGGREEQVGEYIRQYRVLFDTFCHFMSDGKDYALYSPNAYETHLMELPSCRHLGEEQFEGLEFCPVAYYVPTFVEVHVTNSHSGKIERQRLNQPKPDDFIIPNPKHPDRVKVGPLQYCPFGFVAGCEWGDENAWKIQYLDLSQVSQGILKRDARFGYIVLPLNQKLEEAIDMEEFRYDFDPDDTSIYINIRKRFDVETGQMSDF
ncbi:MAG: hypothetical protein K8L91_07390 [Anaerolineae bacterium]|nr:hypothetical protein [Anaerolineae bacterium]